MPPVRVLIEHDVPVVDSQADGTAQDRLDHALAAAISAFFPERAA